MRAKNARKKVKSNFVMFCLKYLKGILLVL
ncbi:unknown [Clostridium sp. CAG:433]|nr:unknown [Clostridium sp. CAG:433]